MFADGLPHNVTLDIASAEANHTLNQNWYVSGLMQVVTDPSGKPTTGKITTYDVQPYATTETTASISGTDVNITVKAQRSLKIESTIVSGSGVTNNIVFQQNLDYANTQYYLNNTYTQVGLAVVSNNLLIAQCIHLRTSCRHPRAQSSQLTMESQSLSIISNTPYTST